MAGQGTGLTGEARRAYFRDLGRQGGETTRAARAAEGKHYFQEIGRIGGKAARRPHRFPGATFFRRVGRKGGAAVRKLIAYAVR